MGGAGPGKKTNCSLLDTKGPIGKESLVGCPALPGQVEMRFPPSFVPGLLGHQGSKVWALQRYAVQSGAPPGRLFGAVQEFHRCLMYLIEMDSLLSISMLDVAEEKPAPSLKHFREDQATRWNRASGGKINCHTYPQQT